MFLHLLLIVIILDLLFAVPGQSATFIVNTNQDIVDANPGDGICETGEDNHICTLRAAMQEANAWPGKDIIQLPSGNYSIALADWNTDSDAVNDFDITDDLTINGSGVETTILNGPGQNQNPLWCHNCGVIEINGPINVEINDLTIQNGYTQHYGKGGGIANVGVDEQSPGGNLSLNRINIRQNFSGSGGYCILE